MHWKSKKSDWWIFWKRVWKQPIKIVLEFFYKEVVYSFWGIELWPDNLQVWKIWRRYLIIEDGNLSLGTNWGHWVKKGFSRAAQEYLGYRLELIFTCGTYSVHIEFIYRPFFYEITNLNSHTFQKWLPNWSRIQSAAFSKLSIPLPLGRNNKEGT